MVHVTIADNDHTLWSGTLTTAQADQYTPMWERVHGRYGYSVTRTPDPAPTCTVPGCTNMAYTNRCRAHSTHSR